MDYMKITTGKRNYEGIAYETTLDMIRASAQKWGDSFAYMFRRKPNTAIVTRTYNDLLQDIEAMGTGLLARGLKGQHIAVMGENCYEWAVTYNAVINGVGVIVPIDRLLPVNEAASLVGRAKVTTLCVTPKLMDLALELLESVEGLEQIIVFDPVCYPPYSYRKPDNKQVWSFSEVVQEGYQLLADKDRSYLDAVVDPNVMSILIFTSGTTAAAKGVMLSQRNICQNVYMISGSLHLEPGWRALSVLPLHHTYETTAGMLVMLYSGACVCFTDGLRYLANNLVEWQINCMIAVPLLMENIYKRVDAKIAESGKSGLVRVMRPVARNLAAIGFHTNRKLFKSVIDGLGGGIQLVISGAAAMDPDIHQAFMDFGIDFSQGYGLTEVSPVVSTGTPVNNHPGTVGPPLPGTEIRINRSESEPGDETGEIEVRSPSVMLGYYEDEEATREVLSEDGWLSTGDMGLIDENGCIKITGRSKSMIVLTNGKKAFPEEIEVHLNKIPGAQESFVWGERNARDAVDICAKLRIDPDASEMKGKSDEAIKDYLHAKIKSINEMMPDYKHVRYILFTTQDYIRTTTLKVKRQDEQDAIHRILEEQGKTMREIDGTNLESLNQA